MGAFEVGEHAEVYVGAHGVVTEVTEDTVTIAGHTYPTRPSLDPQGNGVAWVSLLEPDLDHEFCGIEDDNQPGEFNRGRDDTNAEWITVARRVHDDDHDDTWRWCKNLLCVQARKVGP